MVSFTSTREQHPFFCTFPSLVVSSPSSSSVPPTPPSSVPSTAASPAFSCPTGSSNNACRVQKQRQMRHLVAERLPLPELPFASFVQSDLSKHLKRRDAIVRPVSIAEFGFKTLFSQTLEEAIEGNEEEGDLEVNKRQKSKRTYRSLRFKVGNASAKRLLSGAFAGAVSRTAVAPLETIRTHLMVGSGGRTVHDVFNHIMQDEGWQGLFRGNGVNVIRVAPSKAIEALMLGVFENLTCIWLLARVLLMKDLMQLFAYDTIKKALDKKVLGPFRLRVPTSSIAGAAAGVCSTICTYPLELLKTRLTIQRGVYKNLMDAFVKICQEEGPKELYRGLTPSLIGVVPYAATNYFAYDFLRKLYKKITKQEQVGNLPTLLIGSAAGAFASASTFPLEVARKQMQVGALSGRPAYNSLFHALSCILEQQGPAGLYRGLGASCIKLVPAAGISFMCYEACKRILIEEETS
ncbi:hypothetical protein L7F22_001198 [Adiantum nelumboides]|nr:hypothetical protein [Adiantum nelumboides]